MLELLIGLIKAIKTVAITRIYLEKGFYEQSMDLLKSMQSIKSKDSVGIILLVIRLMKQSLKVEKLNEQRQVLSFLHHSGHSTCLEQLLFHQNARVAAKAKDLVEKHLPLEMEQEAIEEY